MSDNPYSGRAMSSAVFDSFVPVNSLDGDEIVSTVILTLASADGKRSGPTVRIENLLTPSDHSMSVQDARRAVLARARAASIASVRSGDTGVA